MIVAGFGCRPSARTDSFRDALTQLGDAAPPDALAIPADRAGLLAPLAQALGLPLIPVPTDRLAIVGTPTRSAASLAARGVGSVAEAAALAAAGGSDRARLLVARRVSTDRLATCALAAPLPEFAA